MANETRVLANFTESLVYERIPEHIRSIAVDILVDQIGCQIGCSDLPWAKQVHEAYRKAGGSPEATVSRYGDRLPVSAAAFVNSTFGHSFEFDDANSLGHGHPGAEVIPALLAIAEREHISGRDFLTAFVAGYEVRGRIGWAVTPDLNERGGPHPGTACGLFGAAAGVSKMLDLGAEGIYNALGIAGAHSGGLMQFTQSGGSVKRLYCAIAASNGLHAAQLAQAGITGPEEILEGARGLLRVYSNAYRPERLIDNLGGKWVLEHAKFKFYSCVAGIHPTIDGFKKLMSMHGLTPDAIEVVDVSYPSGYHASAGITAPKDLLGMQFSTSYSLALTALKGRNTPREYTLEAMADPAIRGFASRVHVHEEPELGKFTDRAVRIKLRTKTGAAYEELVIAKKAPLSSETIDEKFRLQTGALEKESRERLLNALRSIEKLDDVAYLAPLLAGGKAAGSH